MVSFINKKKTKYFLAVGLSFPSPDTVERLLLRTNARLGLYRKLDVWSEGCYLYPEGSIDPTHCPNVECQKPRFVDQVSGSVPKPVASVSVASVGAALAQMLMDDELRPLFGYRADFDNQNYPDDQYLDIFNGRVYKNYLSNGLFQNPDDIGLMIVVDGFSPKHHLTTSMTSVVCYVMNLDPAER